MLFKLITYYSRILLNRLILVIQRVKNKEIEVSIMTRHHFVLWSYNIEISVVLMWATKGVKGQVYATVTTRMFIVGFDGNVSLVGRPRIAAIVAQGVTVEGAVDILLKPSNTITLLKEQREMIMTDSYIELEMKRRLFISLASIAHRN